MYSDIIPPKKKFQHIRQEEYNSVRFSAPHTSYGQTKSRKTPIMLFLAGCVVVGLLAYHNLYHSSTFTITPRTARFDIKQKVPLVLQGREKDSLTYSLVYVPVGSSGTTTRNPFVSVPTTAQTTTEGITITASTTGDRKRITVINKTGSNVSLRKDTRFDVGGTVYTLDTAIQNPPTTQVVSTSTDVYRVIGFKGYDTYNSVYAIPFVANIKDAPTPTTVVSTATTSSAVSTTPPQDLLSLMPTGTLALQKSTIYDKLVDQSAVVVFDQSVLEEFLKTYISQTEEYYKILKPFGESISYDISILDYTLETSVESGRPIAFTSLTLEIVPKIDTELLPLQFAGFSKDTMNTIQKQIEVYIKFEIRYKPFWTDSVSSADRITVDIREEK